MIIDGIKISPGTAIVFSAIGGGYGVKMQLAECVTENDYILGRFASREMAEKTAAWLNRKKGKVIATAPRQSEIDAESMYVVGVIGDDDQDDWLDKDITTLDTEFLLINGSSYAQEELT